MNPLPPVLAQPVATRAPGGGVRSMRGPVATAGPASPGPVMQRPGQARPGSLQPETLHPALWLAHQVGQAGGAGVPSGFPALDAELPGAGWPRRALTELLLPHAGVGEIRLLGPCLARLLHEQRPVMLFDPPAGLSGAALAALGIDVSRLLVVHAQHPSRPRDGPPGLSGQAHRCRAGSPVEPGGDPLWAVEQSLRSGHVGVVLAWLPPRLAPERLRRLQLAAQAHDGPAFMLREAAMRDRPSPAPLRLVLRGDGLDGLSVQLLKRRGPPLARPLRLALPAVLSPGAAARARARIAAAAQGSAPPRAAACVEPDTGLPLPPRPGPPASVPA